MSKVVDEQLDAIKLLSGELPVDDSFISTFDISRDSKYLKFYFHLYVLFEWALQNNLLPQTLVKRTKSQNGKSLMDCAYENAKKIYKVNMLDRQQHTETWHRLLEKIGEWDLNKPDMLFHNFIVSRIKERVN